MSRYLGPNRTRIKLPPLVTTATIVYTGILRMTTGIVRTRKGRIMADRRLIEDWMPIAAIGIESVRERTPMTPFPAPNRLHVWWARRPLVASRAAILGALLPVSADHKKFLHVLGIHGDPVEAKKRIAQATKDDVRLGKEAYGYARAFSYTPTEKDLAWVKKHTQGGDGVPVILDPTAGGGSIPFEALRLGCTAFGNDLNPVAWLILQATVTFPARYGFPLLKRYQEIGRKFVERCVERLRPFFPEEPKREPTKLEKEFKLTPLDNIPDGYLWARTVKCPYCGGVVPLSPNWRLDGKGTGVRLVPKVDGKGPRVVEFEMVTKLKDQSAGTVDGGNGTCPFPDCGRVIDGNEIKAQAQSGQMGEQLYCVVYKERHVTGYTKDGRPKIKKVRGFRAPRPEDDVREQVKVAFEAKRPEWEARGILPDEEVPVGNKTGTDPNASGTDLPLKRGENHWIDMFSPRQLYGHGTSVEAFHDLVDELGGVGSLSELDKAAMVYLAIAVDKIISYNGIMCRWDVVRVAIRGKFDRHDYAFQWSYGEMAPTITGLGYDWAVEQTGKSLAELIELCGGGPVSDDEDLLSVASAVPTGSPDPIITCGSADSLPDVADASVDAVVMDPPYYDNVMYAELADFFYVWLKRTAGLLYPEPFMNYLTDKDHEAVANAAKFKDFSAVKGSGGAKKRASRDYQERMQAIFTECRRVLKPGGLMVLMFTHKATGAWDALAKGLVDAGFEITASWPINTEAEGSLHIKDKNAAKSTIFLVCRPRQKPVDASTVTYWEEVEPKVVAVVRERVKYFQDNGIRGVDLYLSCFGPALEVFSEHWPMQRGRAMQKPEAVKGAQFQLLEDEDWDPYAVRPEDALNAARVAVKEWRLDQLTKVKRQVHLDPVTEFYALAWDAFESPQFPADEALKLARVVGVSFDQDLRGKVLELKGGDVILWDSSLRAQKGALGTPKPTVMLNVLHHAARIGREQNTGAAKQLLEQVEVLADPVFKTALETILNVLPAPALASGSSGPLAGAAADAAALEKLRRLCFTDDEVPPPEQMLLTPAE